ncbi:EthD domain-containing protein [Antarcticirhabdus aurantiaca]|uniref:EthD domain-containing protein n=1 Tax=Antarcticirhabdus aurantiaca TaxID=2606717 RepID=A0ACD4NQE0_9HYPH|nr:EthD domain-containing protein [Antarcticirhabdus aurantiaca]WAJ28865.1 EthD domain-containing protein [Jeongeuplla avenae]
MPQDFGRSDNLHRAPLRREFASTTKPLIVTPTFVSRVDDTPPGERPQDEGSSRNHRGHGVRHPDRHPGALALEPDPNLAFEHWDEYWRKVHGPKFAWDEPGSSSELVLRYDQVHRLASGPSSALPPPYRAMVDESGRLPSDPEKRVPTFKRPRWDGLAYIVYGEEADIERTLGQEKFAERIIADEQTAFRKVTRGIAREFILIPSARHRDPISLVKIHVRRPELTRDEFQRRLLGEHAQLVMAQGATHEFVRRYAQLHTLGTTQEDSEAERMDAVSILAFASLNDVEDFLVSADHDAISASEDAICGEGSEWWTAVNYSVINRLMPELRTER